MVKIKPHFSNVAEPVIILGPINGTLQIRRNKTRFFSADNHWLLAIMITYMCVNTFKNRTDTYLIKVSHVYNAAGLCNKSTMCYL